MKKIRNLLVLSAMLLGGPASALDLSWFTGSPPTSFSCLYLDTYSNAYDGFIDIDYENSKVALWHDSRRRTPEIYKFEIETEERIFARNALNSGTINFEKDGFSTAQTLSNGDIWYWICEEE